MQSVARPAKQRVWRKGVCEGGSGEGRREVGKSDGGSGSLRSDDALGG